MTKRVLLYSGGMDSWLIDKLWKPDVKLFIDNGSSYAKQERERLPSDVIVEKLDMGKWEREDGIIPLRNLYFVMVASNYGDTIALGATAGDRVLDKSFEFAEKATDLLKYLYQEQHWTPERDISVVLPYKSKTKKDLLLLYEGCGGDLDKAFHESFSCYHPTKEGKECWACKPCWRKIVAFENIGYRIPNEVMNKLVDYVRLNKKALLKEAYDRGASEYLAITSTMMNILQYKLSEGYK